jgi:hypothetical protein
LQPGATRSEVASTEAVEQLAQALERTRRLLGRRSATRRAELAEGLQGLAEAVAVALRSLSERSTAATRDTSNAIGPDSG